VQRESEDDSQNQSIVGNECVEKGRELGLGSWVRQRAGNLGSVISFPGGVREVPWPLWDVLAFCKLFSVIYFIYKSLITFTCTKHSLAAKGSGIVPSWMRYCKSNIDGVGGLPWCVSCYHL